MTETRGVDRQTTTIRVTVAARDRLQEKAASENQSVSQVVESLIKADEDRAFWAEFRRAHERLRANPEAWAEYQAEIQAWQSASLSTLPDDEEEW